MKKTIANSLLLFAFRRIPAARIRRAMNWMAARDFEIENKLMEICAVWLEREG